MSDIDPRYPIGRFKSQPSYTSDEIHQNINRIEAFPQRFEAVAIKLTEAQLATPYREGGWTLRQVIHHVADSHLNAYIRLKWTLTEDTPLIKAYNEKLWAQTPEVSETIQLSLKLLNALHMKWATTLKLLSNEQLQRAFTHPESGRQVTLAEQLALYAWHGDHHLGHLLLIAKS